MDDIVLRFGSVQALEKILRLERFLSSSFSLVHKSDRDVVRTFKRQLQTIKQRFYEFTRCLSADERQIPFATRRSVFRELKVCLRSIDELHLDLSYVRGQWTCPETSVFVKALFEPIRSESTPTQNLSVVLSDAYMFEETDLAALLSKKLDPLHGRETQTPTLFLPKIEVENPLRWATLVHEMGHAIYAPSDSFLTEAEVHAMTKGRPEGIKIVNSWFEEIYCDFISLHLLGPAYLAAFIDFLLSISTEGILERASDSHPPPRLRIQLMCWDLQQKGISANFADDLFNGGTDMARFFDEMFGQRTKAERMYLTPSFQNFEGAFDAHDFRLRLEKAVEDRFPTRITLPPFDKDRFSCLSERLQIGVPIGSSSIVEVSERENASALKDLKSIQESLTNGSDPEPEQLTKALDNVRIRIKETPCNIAEIVNAGWLYKCEHIYKDAVTTIDSFDKEKEESFDKALLNLDNLLRNSIETAYLCSLLSTKDPV
jgi:hypothetical protein